MMLTARSPLSTPSSVRLPSPHGRTAKVRQRGKKARGTMTDLSTALFWRTLEELRDGKKNRL